MFLRLGIAGLIIGAVLMFFGWQEWHLSSGASEKAEEITLEALIKRGPDGNPHIVLDDFVACLNYVYESRKNSKNYSKVWVPVVPMPKDKADLDPEKVLKPTNVACILITEHASDENQLEKILEKDKLQGMVTNKIRSLGSDERNKLKQSYPQTDFDKCIIFEEGRKPGGMGYVMSMGGAGLALFIVGGVLLVMGAKGG